MAEHIEILFPEDQQDGTEATVTRWLVKVGDTVNAHDPVVEIETDKVIVEVAAPKAGRIADIKVQQDEEVNPGDVLCLLDTQQHTDPAAEPGQQPETATEAVSGNADRERLSPAVRRKVQEHDLEIGGIAGSGRDGRITLQDVETLIAERDTVQAAAPAPSSVTRLFTTGSREAEIVPHDKMRKRIADNMAGSLRTAPHVTAVFETDLTAVMKHRKANKEAFANRGTPLTLTAYFTAAAVAAIKQVPRVNSRWSEEQLEIYRHVNMGIGTALGDEGLIVPVLHNAQDMDLKAIAAGLADLTSRARNKQLKPEDVRGGTFTISNHGVSGSLIASPIIIYQPQSAILGVGKIEKRVKVIEVDGEDLITVRPMCYVTLTIDHRVLDAYQTNAFLTEFVSTLENWAAATQK